MSEEPAASAAHELAERYWEGLLRLDPTVGTWIGDERYDDALPDPSDAGRDVRTAFQEQALDDLEAIDRSALPQEDRLTLDILEAAARRELRDLEHDIDRIKAVTHLFGPSQLLTGLGEVQRADTPERIDRYVARLHAFPDFLEAVAGSAEAGARKGAVAPGIVVDRTIAQLERMLAMDPADSPGMKPVGKASEEDRGRVLEALRESVWPAYTSYLEAVRGYRPSASESIGLSALPNGDALYGSQIHSYTSMPLDAREVHELGQEQLAGILGERRDIARSLGFDTAEEAFAEYDKSGENRASSREEMLELVRGQVERSWEAAPLFFGRLPKGNCEVRPVDEYQEADMPGAYYNAPTADGSRPGVYYVNCGDLSERPLHQTATTSFHEANPGHHFQLSIEIEYEGRLPLRVFGGWFVGDAFPEGWGLYSERLADEMGLFLDEYERLGMLEGQAFRAGRLIVDTGLHALGWDRERAVLQMMETGATRMDSEIEVDRYIATPGQALAYMIGKLEIDRWRKESAARDGAEFELREFHDRLLALGSLPLPVLARELGVSARA